MLIAIIYFIIGLIMLYYGADFLIENGKKIAFMFGISPLVIGITIVAFGTSLPDMVVSMIANINGNSGIAIGNVIGSNIANIFMVMGVLAMINDIAVEQWVLDTTLPLLMIITIATFGLIRVPFNRLSGSILYAFFLLFIYALTFV